MIRIEWTDPAVSDLQNIVDYIARDSALYAEAMAERIITACETMTAFPQRGRIVPEVGNPKIREIIINPPTGSSTGPREATWRSSPSSIAPATSAA